MTVIQRFLSTGWDVTEAGCWEWRGSKMLKRGGYGQLNDRGKLLKTHRISYEYHKGPIPEGHLVRHTCDNPPCVNPEHLLTGVTKHNSEDSKTRGRAVHQVMYGENCPSSKLTWEEVCKIRESTEDGVSLGHRYGVSKTSISNIRRWKTWKTQGATITKSISKEYA